MMKCNLICSFFLILPFLASSIQKQVYIVYFGEHNAKKLALHEIEEFHHSYLLSVKKDEEEARASLLYSYKHSINGFAAELTPDEASTLSELEEVVSVIKSDPNKYTLQTTRSWRFVGLEEDEDKDEDRWSLNGETYRNGTKLLKAASYGKNVIVGVLDSGVWPESKSFSEKGMGPVPKSWRGICQTGMGFLSTHCNRKIIGARYYLKGFERYHGRLNTSEDYSSPRDIDGHGTHTASTVAGQTVSDAAAFGGFARGTASGGAPLAHLAIYKVCWVIPNKQPAGGNTCFEEDMLAAIDDAIADGVHEEEDSLQGAESIDPGVRMMYLANEGDQEGINELLDSGIDVNYRDIDDRTALHVAACQGLKVMVELLIKRGAGIDSKDRWGSTPLADAIYYKNHDVIKVLEKYGAKPLMAPMHVDHVREVPEYEMDSSELDFTNSVDITKGTFRMASWRGIQVAVKKLGDEVLTDEDKVRAFRDELELLQRIRHPNVVQFLGAVTQSSPMMIVTEYLPKGDLREYLNKKGALKPEVAVRFGLDIARGVSYLHEIKPAAIIHRDLEPSNILRDDSGHLKVADFGISKMLSVKEDRPLTCQEASCRYIAPEVFKNEEYDTKVDVFSFALILQEMIEGHPPFYLKHDAEVPKSYAARGRPPFTAPGKSYAHGLKELIEECWHENPVKRPTFRKIITRLETIYKRIDSRRRWKFGLCSCFQSPKDCSSRSSRSI